MAAGLVAGAAAKMIGGTQKRMSGGGWRPSVGFDDVVATLTAGFDGGVFAFAVAQQDEATGHITEGNAPVVHQLTAVVAIEGFLVAFFPRESRWVKPCMFCMVLQCCFMCWLLQFFEFFL